MSASTLLIFDSGARPEYCKDVHEIVCLPPGCVVKYNYRDSLISEEAKTLIKSKAAINFDVLILYWQPTNFVRGKSTSADHYDEYLWFPTRIAKLIKIDSRNEKTHFDLELRGFPKHDSALIDPFRYIIDQDGQRPWDIFVSVCSLSKEFQALCGNYDRDNWEVVVDSFQKTWTTQFKDDSFLYIAPPTFQKKQLSPRAFQQAKCLNETFIIPDHAKVVIDIENKEPASRTMATFESSKLTVSSNMDAVKPQEKEIMLRQYGNYALNFDVSPVWELLGQSGRIEIKIHCKALLGVGPDTKLNFVVRKETRRWIMGLLAIAIGAFLCLSKIMGVDLTGVMPYPLALALGIAMVVAGGIIIYERLPRKMFGIEF